MRKIKWKVSMRLAGCEIEGELEVEDNAADYEIEEDVRELVLGKIDWCWEEIGE